jgi:hypothetical protein
LGRQERLEVIRQIEERRKSRVLVYVTGDRQPVPAQLGNDAVRFIYEHLRALDRVDRLDVFIYSQGGALDVPWRLAMAFRRTAKEWNMLVPLRANSAATLLALGADAIVVGRQAELGPIDPIMTIQKLGDQQPGGPPVQDTINVEDIMSYVRFVQDRVGLTDQSALTSSLGLLANRLDAVGLGNAFRTHSHIRDVARRMLVSRNEPAPEATLSTIVVTLAEKVYAHNHAIGLKDAQDIGLPATAADDGLDDLMWRLFTDYETEMKLLEPLDPVSALGTADKHEEDWINAVIESTWGAHAHSGKIEVQAVRQMPATLNVSLNLNLQMPAGIAQAQQAQIAQFMQQLQPLILQEANRAAQDALKQQAPMAGVNIKGKDFRWRRTS